ncbi:MAG: TVP38/TMEM64 family protein [Candidatus Omnitrophica bacterium]|nr:TVP38/TMEM64 family protein [Candidatus Omnitrophota bacterium]
MNNMKWIVAAVLIMIVGGSIFFLADQHTNFCPSCLAKNLNPEVIRHYIQGFGTGAILVYIVLYTVNTLTLIPPIAFMSLSAGALFGPIWGTVALTVGAFCGTTATFFIARYLGGGLVEKFVKGRADEFNKRFSENGFVVLLPIRLIGFPPYEFVNYAVGLSKISYRDYISATMLGMSPAIIIQVLLADRLANFSWKDPVLYAAVGMFIAMGVITGKIIKKKQAEDKAAAQAAEAV